MPDGWTFYLQRFEFRSRLSQWIEDWIGYQEKENPGNEDHLASTGKHYHPPRPYALVFS